MAQWQGCADLQCPTALMGDGGVDQFVHGLIQGKLVRIELDALWVLQTPDSALDALFARIECGGDDQAC